VINKSTAGGAKVFFFQASPGFGCDLVRLNRLLFIVLRYFCLLQCFAPTPSTRNVQVVLKPTGITYYQNLTFSQVFEWYAIDVFCGGRLDIASTVDGLSHFWPSFGWCVAQAGFHSSRPWCDLLLNFKIVG